MKVNCQLCGEQFEAKRSDARWCPDKCRRIKRAETYKRTDRKTKYGTCPECGARKYNRSKTCKSCARKGERNNFWKGGRYQSPVGYVYIYKPEHPRAVKYHGNYVPEHHLSWEKANGRYVPEGQIIHHLNGVKDDNRPENLMALDKKYHSTRTILAITEERIRQLEAALKEKHGTGVRIGR